ncbi:MAG: tRNA (N(6)-L-threonylcarbamoyladenosine(37)-C(2))-methylthiotransferase MtaB [Bacillota bacterium]|nr:tRNA (N(6)-L-threonylcarbamoyladenosine(37)-C(2))-methylthiotransferase MtaB [Bacillota bacterium]
MKVAFSTLGCRVNQYESEAMAEKFITEGYEIVHFNEFADVYVINTCTVTNMGDKKSRQMIGRARRLNNDSVVAVVGCYSQIAPLEVSKIQGVDVVLGTRNKGEIIYWINRYKEEKKQQIAVNEVLKNNVFEELNIEEYQDKTRAFLKIQDGCNNFCSYCLIPFARGAVCSKKPEKVIEEVNKLAFHGFQEVILSGIHTASYGIDFNEKFNLLDLLEAIDKIEGIKRIRIGSMDPNFFTEDVIYKIKNIKKLCPHFHLSLQSGCDETLKRMNRHYNSKEYITVTENLRNNIPDVSVTTDVIVGFPGETDEEFNKTYNFLESIKLTKMHIFKYSPRKGTKASSMENQIENHVKDERSNKLIELSKKLEDQFYMMFDNMKMDVLYEKNSDNDKNLYEGYTSNYIKVVTESKQNIIGKIISTKLLYCSNELMKGIIE